MADATVQPPTYWFYGRFSPAPPKPLHVPKAFGIADVYGVNLMGDAFWIALPDRRGRDFDLLMNEVEHLATVFAGAYAMKSELGMRAFVEAWVESRATGRARRPRMRGDRQRSNGGGERWRFSRDRKTLGSSPHPHPGGLS